MGVFKGRGKSVGREERLPLPPLLLILLLLLLLPAAVAAVALDTPLAELSRVGLSKQKAD